MYGLPKDFDVSVFVGKELTQICFAINLVSIHFEKGIRITSEESLGYSLSTENNADANMVYQIPVRNCEIMELIGHTITEATVEGRGGLRLRFDNGHSLIFYDDKPNYESYHIQLGDEEIHI